ncbi:MAG: hypothetical protein AUJ74_06900 [Candidatus Omnitrophica bacterium CG1_02_44_16]|nr:MAG: hypothetical protein AUJ74_06900 [Candidatus Omnitrophica bacterium CG1_02_44_16]PIY81947.1 MAG: hypothetical protein COY78_09285 [Candidatus Omnitrophica bacterium CG_4_10_14_0_8_um_filter_44_12]PIZ84788.1 MAG: hypothetical protein COX96_02095 [Candidatus Omnitrophica bacterium CG_4_10_14_0_2_um_filter_44_9]
MPVKVLYSNKYYIFFAVAAIIVLSSLVKATTDLNKFKRNFRDEMAQRLDLEEKTMSLQNGRAAISAEAKILRAEVIKNKRVIAQLKEELALEQSQKAVFVAESKNTSETGGV